MLALLALTLAAAAPADTLVPGVLRGTVQSDPSGLPVATAVVQVGDSLGGFRSFSDSTGSYRLGGLPPGRHTLRVRHLEHAPLELDVVVPAGQQVVLDLTLRYRPLALDTVRTAAPGVAEGDTVAASRADLSVVDVRARGDGGPPAGPAAPPEGAPGSDDALVVRGTAADLKLVLLDGAPVYAPFHTGGLLESFEPAVLREARLHLAGAPARYDGGLSYVMELSTRGGNGERHASAGTVDMMTARGMAEGPLWRGATYLAAGRAVHGTALGWMEAEPFPYEFWDGLARVDMAVPGQGRVRLTGFGNHEGVRLDPEARADGFASWGNRAGSLRYSGTPLGTGGELTVALGDFRAWVPQRRTQPLQGHTQRLRVTLDLAHVVEGVRLRYGASWDDMRIRNRIDVWAADEVREVTTRLGGAVVSGYLDGALQLGPRVVLRGGGRLDVFSETVELAASPRLSATWLVGDGAALTLAGGRFHQYLRVRPAAARLDPATSGLADSVSYVLAGELRPADATHLSVALDQQMPGGVRLGLEGFYKRYGGVAAQQGMGTYSSGVDTWVRRSQGRHTGWIGYTLAWAWSASDPSEPARPFSGRHALNAGLAGPVWRGAHLSARLQLGGDITDVSAWGAGGGGGSDGTLDDFLSPTSGNSGGSAADQLEADGPVTGSALAPGYVRLDAQLQRTWAPRLNGRRMLVTPYLRVINALNRRDPIFYDYRDRSDGGASPGAPRGVGTLPLVPVFGLDWRF